MPPSATVKLLISETASGFLHAAGVTHVLLDPTYASRL